MILKRSVSSSLVCVVLRSTVLAVIGECCSEKESLLHIVKRMAGAEGAEALYGNGTDATL